MHPFLSHLRAEMAAAADPEKAAPMQAYMKTDQPFYGLPSVPRRRIFRDARRRFPISSREDYEAVILDLWHGTHREEQYQALEVAEHYKKYRNEAAWPLFEHLVRTATNWDTLDWIASKLVGDLVRRYRHFEDDLRQWRHDENLWVRRASLLAHLKHKQETNVALLAETILLLAPENEFFIRKAIGWVLREYARTDPDWVRAFVHHHAADLSGLSRREAMKHLG